MRGEFIKLILILIRDFVIVEWIEGLGKRHLKDAKQSHRFTSEVHTMGPNVLDFFNILPVYP